MNAGSRRVVPTLSVVLHLLRSDHTMRIFCLLALAACTTTGSPLTQIGPQVEVHVDPDRVVDLTITTWNNLAALRDAMSAGEITAKVDGQPLFVNAAATGTYGNGGSYVAAFMTGPGATRESPMPPPEVSMIAISDGETTWTATIEHMFANDLAPTGPLVAGTDVFEWPSAASPNPWSTISSACVGVEGAAPACEGGSVDSASISISQEFITATIEGASGAHVRVEAQREINPQSTGNGPQFMTTIAARYDGALE